jgi:hypothetical protein
LVIFVAGRERQLMLSGIHVLDLLAWMLRFGYSASFCIRQNGAAGGLTRGDSLRRLWTGWTMNPVVLLAIDPSAAAAFNPPNATALWPVNASNSPDRAPQV